MEWTPEQRRIIDYGKGDLLVSASAGSGKTTVMLGRVMRLIEEGVSLRNMLISTFTVSAADDMRGKLARKLREKIAELSALKGGEDDGAATEKRCRDALDYLPNADICTLHKYCQKLIRKYFYVTGDDPAFEIADEGECAIWRNEAVTQAMTEAAAGALPDYPAVLRLYMKRRSDARVREIVTEVMTFVDAQEDADAWLAHACDAYADDGKCRAYLSAVAAERYGAVMARADELDMHAAAMDLLSKAKKYTDEVRARVNGADIAYSRAAGHNAGSFPNCARSASARTTTRRFWTPWPTRATRRRNAPPACSWRSPCARESCTPARRPSAASSTSPIWSARPRPYCPPKRATACATRSRTCS